MALVVGTNSWLSEADANLYFDDRVGVADYWTDDAAENPRALITAYKELNNCGKYSFPTTATQVMKDAQCEYSLHLLIHTPDRAIREGIQAQRVVKAGVVKEEYHREGKGIIIPPLVASLLSAYETEKPFHIFDIERDEEQETDYDAVSNLDRDV